VLSAAITLAMDWKGWAIRCHQPSKPNAKPLISHRKLIHNGSILSASTASGSNSNTKLQLAKTRMCGKSFSANETKRSKRRCANGGKDGTPRSCIFRQRNPHCIKNPPFHSTISPNTSTKSRILGNYIAAQVDRYYRSDGCCVLYS